MVKLCFLKSQENNKYKIENNDYFAQGKQSAGVGWGKIHNYSNRDFKSWAMGSCLIIILLCFIVTYICYMLVINITFNKITEKEKSIPMAL